MMTMFLVHGETKVLVPVRKMLKTLSEWKIACKEELEALYRHNVFKLTDLPKGRKTIGCRWVFDVKSDGCKKARLVAQGFSQVEGIDFNELFSPVVHFESV
jgi:hypothetical protein